MTQDDILLPQLTVEETLVFSAFLRLPSDMSLQQKYAKVEMIMKELGLERYMYHIGVIWRAFRWKIMTYRILIDLLHELQMSSHKNWGRIGQGNIRRRKKKN